MPKVKTEPSDEKSVWSRLGPLHKITQRSPTWVAARPSRDAIADRLRRYLPTRVAYPVVRWKNILLGGYIHRLSRRRPHVLRRLLRKGLVAQLPPGYDIDTHFTPDYDPWDQRLCLAPDGDLFREIRAGRVSVVTDHVEGFTATGVRLRSGTEYRFGKAANFGRRPSLALGILLLVLAAAFLAARVG
jgi:cation diffusion facilitator CzcD-associated flavoprotein CzcO